MARFDRDELWLGVDRLLDGAAARRRPLSDLRLHRVHLLLAQRIRLRGERIPAELERDERNAAFAALAAPVVLKRARDAYDGPLMLMKGPEVAAEYPDPLRRPFMDLDLLAGDPRAAQLALQSAGFEPIQPAAPFDGHHHLAPLIWPGLPLVVEIHRRPHWVDGLEPPSPAELFEAGVPTREGVAGVLAPAPEHHALLLAAHGWAHGPLTRLGRLIDAAALTVRSDERELELAARRWRCARLWRLSCRVVERVLLGRGRPLPLKLWAPHLAELRDRSVLELHAERWLAPLWGLQGRDALAALAATFATELRPCAGENWIDKATRVSRAMTHATLAESQYLAGVAPAHGRKEAER
jgi:Uncharacterised nucleotidyltransferase